MPSHARTACDPRLEVESERTQDLHDVSALVCAGDPSTLVVVTERAPLSRKLSAIAESATLKVDAKAKALKAEGKDPATAVVVYMGGDPSDGNAKMFHDGAVKVMEAAGIKPD